MNGPKFIVIEGLDGSGKSTQLELLESHLTKEKIPFRQIHFPRLGHEPYGALVAEFLRGDFGNLEMVHPKLVALLYAGDRHDFSDTISKWLAEGNLVVADRYVYSNIAFQCAKCADPIEKQNLKNWILDFEYVHHKIPKPDVSLFLDVSIHVASKAMEEDSNRDTREYLTGSQDIHEADVGFQSRVHQEYLDLTAQEPAFYRLQCVDDAGHRLTPYNTHLSIIRKLQELRIL